MKIENAPVEPSAPARDAHYRVGEVIAVSHAAGPRLWRLAFGWAAQAVTLSDGRRQILRLYVPGDLCEAPHIDDAGPGELLALTRVRASPLGDATALDGRIGVDTGLAALLRQSAREDRRWAGAQILRLGRLTAIERMGHLLLDLYERAGGGGLTSGATILLPLTQAMLSDVLGLSVLHTERVLQQLRRDGLIVLRLGHVTLLDPERLAATSHFTSAPRRPAA
ncbi:Crp/Fnr family transcriptional regulator [Phenylobacterium sp. J426]|uniref:Crp/Fnr family transcriptional regulator n=1 Tax=Phenylobacterium sp. J426 TaxID=2898439 RepID=UPI00215149F9|nr:Crp/Fnr family transcriptional regulator [Phenylobacterium sp. J426]MCR5876599.1 Crp/Fnr family transcriptional regulator [Phenylobacterium sp. J426]